MLSLGGGGGGGGGVPARPYLLLPAWMYRPVLLLQALGQVVYRHDLTCCSGRGCTGLSCCWDRCTGPTAPRATPGSARTAQRTASLLQLLAAAFQLLANPLFLLLLKKHGFKQCCGSGSGIRCLFDPWIQDPGWEEIRIRIRDEQPGSYFRA